MRSGRPLRAAVPLSFVVGVGLALGSLGCGEAPVELPDSDASDAGVPAQEPDASGSAAADAGASPQAADASIASPDASIASPDARIASPDASIASPDARIASPDARIAPPDARIAPPDATPVGSDPFAGYRSYHVSHSGSDGDGLTAQTAWRTIGQANAALRAGERVLIHAGTYSEQIRPARSGNSNDERIVYQAYGDGPVVLDRFVWQQAMGAKGVVALGARTYVTVSGRAPAGSAADRLIQIRPTNTTEVYGNFTGSTGCVVENVLMERGAPDIGPNRGWAFADYWYQGSYESKYNVLRNCTIHGYAEGATPANYTEDTITLAKNAHHNLIENCVIGECRHVSLNQNQGTTHSNVFRGNVVYNPEHTAMSAYGLAESNYRQDHHLIEGNTLRASGETHSPRGGPGNALQFATHETVVRYNLISEAGAADSYISSLGGIALSSGSNGPRANDNRFYNNTIVHNSGKAIGSHDFGGGQDKGRNRFWNNVIYDSHRTDGSQELITYWRSFDDGRDRWVRNVMGNPGGSASQTVMNIGRGSVSLATAAATYANPDDPEFSDWAGFSNVYDANLQTNTFVDYAGKDYALRATSPYVDAGAPLTRVASADTGSGTTLRVEDARFFYGEAGAFPGWMNVQNDWIAVGSAPGDLTGATKVQIASVDDAGNTLTLSRAVARRPGDFVWLWKSSSGAIVVRGKAPDLGALER